MANLDRLTDEGFWRGRSVFVTGGGGFVGSWLVRALLERGARVVCLLCDDGKPTSLSLLGIEERIESVRGDLVDLSCLERALAEHEVGTCFHLAAQPIVGVANASPLRTFESNIRGTWNLLEACRTASTIERVVVASSDKAYGDHDRLPYVEELPLQATYPYDVSKACADLLARSYARTYGMPVALTRMANIYGGADLNFSRIVPGTIKSLLDGEDPIIRSDGTPVRDYLYVEDAVRGYLTLAEHLPNAGVSGEAFNFGTREPISVLQLVERIIEHAGARDARPQVLSATKLHGEIDRQFLDSGKARRLLGWEPVVTLEDGLSRTIGWYRDRQRRLPKGSAT